MERVYNLLIEAEPVHQPTQAEIMRVVRELVDTRAKEFPTSENRTSVSMGVK